MLALSSVQNELEVHSNLQEGAGTPEGTHVTSPLLPTTCETPAELPREGFFRVDSVAVCSCRVSFGWFGYCFAPFRREQSKIMLCLLQYCCGF